MSYIPIEDRISASSVHAVPRNENGRPMKKTRHNADADDMKREYDFSGGVRGKYARRYAEGTNVVFLDADLVKLFPDSESVNRALRSVVAARRRRHRKAS